MANIINGSDNFDDWLMGSSGDDIIDGFTGKDTLLGGDGNDTLSGGYGNNDDHDSLYGGNGDDTLYGYAGNDTVFGGYGTDSLYGGSGNDVYRYEKGTGNDRLIDDSGEDTLLMCNFEGVSSLNNISLDISRFYVDHLVIGVSGAGVGAGSIIIINQFSGDGWGPVEHLKTEDGSLFLTFQRGLIGTAGDDILVGHDTVGNVVDGGAGNDWQWGGSYNDTLIGGDGNDNLHGNLGDDSLSGGAGADTFFGGLGIDTIDGGPGEDTVSFRDRLYVYANLSGVEQVCPWNNNSPIYPDMVFEPNGASSSFDRLLSVEAYKDAVWGDHVILGRSGIRTTVYISQGNDVIEGGASDDITSTTVSYADDIYGAIINLGGTAVTVTLDNNTYSVEASTARDGWGGTDWFILDERGFSIEGSGLDDYIHGRDEANIQDFIAGGAGDDTIDGGAGKDTVNYDSADTTSATAMGVVVNLSPSTITPTVDGISVTMLAGQARDNWGNIDQLSHIEDVLGSRLDDYIVGSGGDNVCQGGKGDDYIRGYNGNDQLYGGPGNDTLVGGSGQDKFIFDTLPTNSGNLDRLTDFDPVYDSILLEDGVMAGLPGLGELSAAAFYSASDATAAHAASDRIIYNTTTGALYFDADGTGLASAAVKFAVLGSSGARPVLTAADFVVV